MKKQGGSLEQRLATYGSMSLALAAVAMPAAGAQGSIFNTDLTATSGAPVYFDPATGYAGLTPAESDFELFVLQSNSAFRASILNSPASSHNPNGNMFAVSSSAARLSPGTTVGPLLTFGSALGTLASNSGFGHWNAVPITDDLGLSQTCGAPSGVCYGWANITVNADHSITLNAFGYDSSGDALAAGEPTPEPASIILLAMGAAGIAAWRRKKTALR